METKAEIVYRLLSDILRKHSPRRYVRAFFLAHKLAPKDLKSGFLFYERKGAGTVVQKHVEEGRRSLT